MIHISDFNTALTFLQTVPILVIYFCVMMISFILCDIFSKLIKKENL